jgi:hypothetical protein
MVFTAMGLVALVVGLSLALNVVQLYVIIKFWRVLTAASQGSADHFEKLRKVRQVGV